MYHFKLPQHCERNPEKKFLLVNRLGRTDDNGVRTVDTCLENKRKGVLILEISLLLLSRPAIKVATVFCLCFIFFFGSYISNNDNDSSVYMKGK